MCAVLMHRSGLFSVKCLARSSVAGLLSQDVNASENLCELLRLNEHEVRVNTEGENMMGRVMNNARLLPLITAESTNYLKTTTYKCEFFLTLSFNWSNTAVPEWSSLFLFSLILTPLHKMYQTGSVQFSSACLHLLLNVGKYLTIISSRQPVYIKKNLKPLWHFGSLAPSAARPFLL